MKHFLDGKDVFEVKAEGILRQLVNRIRCSFQMVNISTACSAPDLKEIIVHTSAYEAVLCIVMNSCENKN